MNTKIALFIILLTTVVYTADCYATPANDTIRIKYEPYLPDVFHNDKVSIFIDWAYSGYEPSEFEHMLTEDWYDLLKNEETNNFTLEKSDISIGRSYNDCLQDSITIVSSANNICMIKGISQKDRQLKSIIPKKNELQPGEKLDFVFNKQKYTLRGEGIVNHDENKFYIIDGGDMGSVIGDIINYKLYLSTHGKEQLLLSIPRSSTTFVQILFIGDLDEDGKPDFVFDTSHDYEERRVTLFLSSPAEGDEIVRATDEADNQFDC